MPVDTSGLDAITATDLADMTVADRKTLATKINLLLKEIEELNWRDETYPQQLESVKTTIAKFGVSFHEENETMVADLEENSLFDVNKIRVNFDITAYCDSDWRLDEETAEFSEYSDYDFSKKYSDNLPDKIDFGDVYRGENISWKQDGPISMATYSVYLYAVTKKLDLEKISTQVPAECFYYGQREHRGLGLRLHGNSVGQWGV